jgi:hypothetical protein
MFQGLELLFIFFGECLLLVIEFIMTGLVAKFMAIVSGINFVLEVC